MASPGVATAWPALTYEEYPWTPSEPTMWSRTVQKRHRGSYRAAVPAAIAACQRIGLEPEILALVDDASRAATRFDAEFGTDLLPFASLLLRSESAASSKIENLTASARAIALAELDEGSGTNAGIIVANVRAMTASQPEIVGQWRNDQVWIGGSGAGPHQAIFVPPHDSRVAEAMDDLLAFIARDDIPALAHVALAHAQFETIHPFPDGNGRTGRALIHAMLMNKGLVQNVTVPLSAGILTDVDSYFAALTSYRQGSTSDIVELVANATFRAIVNGERLIADLRAQRNDWKSSISANSNASLWRVIDLLLRYPVINSKLVESELEVTPKTALDAIDRLVTEGVLTQIGTAKRNRKWQAPAILSELDAFAERAGRRNL